MQLLGNCSVAAHTWHGKLSLRMELAWKWQWPLTSLSPSLWGRIPRRKTNGWAKGKGGGQETCWEVVAVTQERDEGDWHHWASCGALRRWIDSAYVLNIGLMGFADGIKIWCGSRISLRFVAWITGIMKSKAGCSWRPMERKLRKAGCGSTKWHWAGNAARFHGVDSLWAWLQVWSTTGHFPKLLSKWNMQGKLNGVCLYVSIEHRLQPQNGIYCPSFLSYNIFNFNIYANIILLLKTNWIQLWLKDKLKQSTLIYSLNSWSRNIRIFSVASK